MFWHDHTKDGFKYLSDNCIISKTCKIAIFLYMIKVMTLLRSWLISCKRNLSNNGACVHRGNHFIARKTGIKPVSI